MGAKYISEGREGVKEDSPYEGSFILSKIGGK